MPMRAAISGIGWRRALRAISRSVGNVTAICPPVGFRLCGARQHVLAPLFCRFDLVESEEVKAGDLAFGEREVRKQCSYESAWLVAAGLEHAQEPVGVAAQEAR